MQLLLFELHNNAYNYYFYANNNNNKMLCKN